MIKNKCLLCDKNVEKLLKHGYHPECFQKIFNLEDINADFEDLIFREAEGKSSSDRNKRITTSTFYHGAFKKYSARMESQKLILKVREQDYPELPKIEYLSNKIAEALGIEVAPYFYLLLNNKIPTFCTRNVLDFHDKGNLIHIWHYLIMPDGQLEELTLKNIISILKNETNRPIDVKKFIQISLFDMVIGNGDRHGRNLAIIEMQNKKMLSPAYDNPSNIGIMEEGMLGVDLRVKGKIYTDHSIEPTLKDYIHEFEQSGYKKICDEFIIKAKDLNYEKIINNERIKLSSKRKKAFLGLITKSLKEIEND